MLKARENRWSLWVGLLFTGCLVGCADSSSHVANRDGSSLRSQGKIQLSGSSTIGPLASEIGKRYEKIHAGIRVDVQTGGSSRGIADVKNGLSDIGMSSRALIASEKDGRLEWPIANDGVCFIVHASNPVSELSRSQLLGVLKGEITNWKDVGGVDGKILLIDRARGRSEFELVTKFFDLKTNEIRAAAIAGENQEGIQRVAANSFAISYMSIGATEDSIKRGESLKALPLEGVAATVANVEAGNYALARPLILVTPADPPAEVRKFIEFAQSEEVHDIVRQLSYVPITN